MPSALTLVRNAKPKPTIVFESYWRFAVERQNVFFRRLNGLSPPWTRDPIIETYKFTNAYRASDRVSQYLIQNVIYTGVQTWREVFFRTLLFKIFNRISTWELLSSVLDGEITFRDYSYEKYDQILTKAMADGRSLFSAAYIMPSGSKQFGTKKKHRAYLQVLELMMSDELPERLQETRKMRDAFTMIRKYPLIGDFLAYQYLIDLNYSDFINFPESEYIVPGPGARNGIRKCFDDLGGFTDTDIIHYVADEQENYFESFGLMFKELWGRPLQLIDCQNLFCEIDKYARVKYPECCGVTKRTKIKQKYKVSPEPLDYWYPPKWGINHRIAPSHGDQRGQLRLAGL